MEKLDVQALSEAIDAYRSAVLVLTIENENGEVRFDYYARKLDKFSLHTAVPLESFPFHSFPFARPVPARPFSNFATEHDRLRSLLAWLHRMRHNKPFWRDLQESERGDIKASSRILRTVRDYESLRRPGTGSLPLPTKCESDHTALFRFGLYYGLDRLNADELSSCFDELCPCPRKKHSTDYLKKLRTSITREFEPGWEPSITTVCHCDPAPVDL
jgi:hypothetical protein